MLSIRQPARRVAAYAAAGLTAVVATLLPMASPASASYDDGNPNGHQQQCENYEICFTYWESETTDLKQFWYNANHNAVPGNHVAYYFHPNGQRLMDNARKLRNRDSRCTVYVWDVDSYGHWFVYASQGQQAGGYINVVADRNNGHSRCNSDGRYPPDND